MTTHAEAIRDIFRALPSLAATSSGSEPTLEEIYYPEPHAEALDPDVSLVIGNRGMGKTFWSRALWKDDLRPEIAKKYSSLRSWNLDKLVVEFGFADAEGSNGAISRAHLESVTEHPPELVWRAVLIRKLAQTAKVRIPAKFPDLVAWVKSDPDGQLAIFRSADEAFTRSGRQILFLFDQLDQLATDWQSIQNLTKGLLKIALSMKSYRNIKMKIFMRPDQADNRDLFSFPDASKISGGRRLLTWRPIDLYGLVFFEIFRQPEGKRALTALCKKAGVDPKKLHPRLQIPELLVTDSVSQAQVFDLIAGEMMGGGSKRGRPYTWIPTHLADARGEISPRVFLKVMKAAALAKESFKATAIDFVGINQGVREASENRLSELEEDYPWIRTSLAALHGILVPCLAGEMYARWNAERTIATIKKNFSGSRAPIDLVFADARADGHATLLRLLAEVGVLELRSNGKINVPDIFRVNAGILRKGGIVPQQRLKA